MTITQYTYPLDNEFNNYIKVILTYNKGLKDMVVIYYTVDEGREVPLVTYDLVHGFPHRISGIWTTKTNERRRNSGHRLMNCIPLQ